MTAAAGRHFYICVLLIQALFCSLANRSSYPDRTEGEDAEMDEEELPDDKTLEYDEETLELTLPSGNVTHQKTVSCLSRPPARRSACGRVSESTRRIKHVCSETV